MSGEVQGEALDLRAVTEGGAAPDTGVRAGAELVAFAEAAVRGDASLPDARRAVAEALGNEALVEAAAVVGNFERMVRIADGTGIALDAPMELLSDEIRSELGIGAFPAATHTPESNPARRVAGHLLTPLAFRAIRLAERWRLRHRG